jgi:2-polyprenyl-6-methoxyphenol hydroxylase-like FAD-dependent oxidoreductase
MKTPLKVTIIGAGTGGLCLAQGLKSDNIAVEVFERDDSPTDRLQGYRLSINRAGSEALKSCLHLRRGYGGLGGPRHSSI